MKLLNESKKLEIFFRRGMTALMMVLCLTSEYVSAAPAKEELILLRNAQWDAILSLQDQVKNNRTSVSSDSTLSEKAQKSLLKKLDKVASTLSCVKKKAFSAKYVDTTSDGNSIMHVERLEIAGGLIKVSNKNIYIHPLAYKIAKSFFVGTTIHELSHQCGTDDLEYYTQDLVMPSNVITELTVLPKTIEHAANNSIAEMLLDTKTDWVSNADHYRMWSEYGFCIPGYNCNNLFFSEDSKLKRRIGYYVKAEKILDFIAAQQGSGGYPYLASQDVDELKELYKEYLGTAVRKYEFETDKKLESKSLFLEIILAKKRI